MLTDMKRTALLSLCSILLVAAGARAAESSLERAGKLLLGGKYAEAAEIYAPQADKEPAAALGLARSLEAQGKTDQAVRTLAALAEKRPELQAELARLAFDAAT